MPIADSKPTIHAPPRWLGIALVVALALHAVLLAVWLSRLMQASNDVLPPGELVPVIAVAALGAVLAFVAFPKTPQCALASLVAIAACALVGVGAVATVGLMTLSAYAIGGALLDWSSGPHARGDAGPPHAAIAVLVGSSVWIGAIAASLAWQVHYAYVDVLAIAASLAAFPRHTRRAVAGAAAWLTTEASASWPERACAALACVIAIVHLVVVAKPEVGYDASTMHLQFAEIVATDHRWRFDVTRYAWAVMPMGADDVYLAAYLIDGERAARLVNLLFGALLCTGVYALVRLQASRIVALASVCMLASTPLWFLESGTLFVEFAWTAFLVGGLVSTLAFLRERRTSDAAAAAMCLAGAMACKVIAIFWIVPLALVVGYALLRQHSDARGRLWTIVALAVVVGGFPYVNAWLRTGNPVFPFMNALFASPLYPAVDFNNPLYNAPLTAATPYDLVMRSGRYLEGDDGASGIQWLLLFPLAVAGLLARPRGMRGGLFALAAGFAVLVFVEQSYLRYLLPAFVLLAVLAGFGLGDWIRSQAAMVGLIAATALVTVVNLALMPSANWTNRTLCLRCSQDPGVRRAYVALHAPLRIVADYLNRNLADARVGFFVFNAAAPSGFVGYSRAANWHDSAVFDALVAARTPDDVAAVVRRFRLTHAVFLQASNDPLDSVLLAYRDRNTTPVARIGRYVITAIRQRDDDSPSPSSAAAR